MDLDQWLFQKAARWLTGLRRRAADRRSSHLPFRSAGGGAGRLLRFADLVTGVSVDLIDEPGKIKLIGGKLCLPFSQGLMTSADLSRSFLELGILLISAKPQTNLFRRLRWLHREYGSFAKFLQPICTEMHQLRKNHSTQHKILLKLLISAEAPERSPDKAGLQSVQGLRKEKAAETRRTSHSIAVKIESPEMLEPDRAKIEEYTLGHNFEKIETAEEFDGVWRDLDGSDELQEHRDALQDLKLKHFIRSDDATHATIETEAGATPGGEMAEVENSRAEFFYPEWDFRRNALREKHCGLLVEEFTAADEAFVAASLRRTMRDRHGLERRTLKLIQEKNVKRRLVAGDTVDLDATIESFGDLAAGITPSENIYARRSRAFSDLYIHLLTDISLSTDSFIAGRRIVEVEKDALIAFGECLDKYHIRFAVSAFYSRTRNHCRFLKVKEELTPWQGARNRLGALEPVGYTRIGPALRHAESLMGFVAARQKWVILLTDLRPNDYDYYEGRYGIEDVRHAVRELRQSGIRVHALAIGKGDKASIPLMMQGASYRVLSDATRLTEALGDFFQEAAK